MGGGGKHTRIVTAYQPCKPGGKTRGETVWDQHTRYYTARGEIRNPRAMFKSDLSNLLLQWKANGDEILLFGDFNEDVYQGELSLRFSQDDLWMSELCRRTVGTPLPSTHMRGRVPIDAVFATTGVHCSLVTLLPSREGVGDLRVFVLDISSESLLGDVFPRVIPASRRLLNCDSDRIRQSYIAVLNQLVNQHKIFRKLLYIDNNSDNLPIAQIQLSLNKVDLEIEEFMKTSERSSHRFKRNLIEWSPYAGEWIHRRWLLVRIHKYLKGKIKDPRNLFRDCRQRGIKHPLLITMDELRAEVCVFRRNIDLLMKNSPFFRLKFLNNLVAAAKNFGDTFRASKVMGIIIKEKIRKRWRRINRSTRKPRGSLTVRVKVPTADGGHTEYKSKEGLFKAVSPILLDRFQSALVAPCHRGQFFEDVGHLVDGPVSQEILEGTYEYP